MIVDKDVQKRTSLRETYRQTTSSTNGLGDEVAVDSSFKPLDVRSNETIVGSGLLSSKRARSSGLIDQSKDIDIPYQRFTHLTDSSDVDKKRRGRPRKHVPEEDPPIDHISGIIYSAELCAAPATESLVNKKPHGEQRKPKSEDPSINDFPCVTSTCSPEHVPLTESTSKKPRGRPRKHVPEDPPIDHSSETTCFPELCASPASESLEKSKKPRGNKRNLAPVDTPVNGLPSETTTYSPECRETLAESTGASKKRPGRPRKHVLENTPIDCSFEATCPPALFAPSSAESLLEASKKRRGRPRKRVFEEPIDPIVDHLRESSCSPELCASSADFLSKPLQNSVDVNDTVLPPPEQAVAFSTPLGTKKRKQNRKPKEAQSVSELPETNGVVSNVYMTSSHDSESDIGMLVCSSASFNVYTDFVDNPNAWSVLSSQEQRYLIKDFMKKSSHISCLSSSCTKSLTTIGGIIYHLYSCGYKVHDFVPPTPRLKIKMESDSFASSAHKHVNGESTNILPDHGQIPFTSTDISMHSNAESPCFYMDFMNKIDQWREVASSDQRQMLERFAATSKKIPCLNCDKVLTTSAGMVYHLARCGVEKKLEAELGQNVDDGQMPSTSSSGGSRTYNYLDFMNKMDEWRELSSREQRKALECVATTGGSIPCLNCDKILKTPAGMVYHLKRCGVDEKEEDSEADAEERKAEQNKRSADFDFFSSTKHILMQPLKPRRSAALAKEKLSSCLKPSINEELAGEEGFEHEGVGDVSDDFESTRAEQSSSESDSSISSGEEENTSKGEQEVQDEDQDEKEALDLSKSDSGLHRKAHHVRLVNDAKACRQFVKDFRTRMERSSVMADSEMQKSLLLSNALCQRLDSCISTSIASLRLSDFLTTSKKSLKKLSRFEALKNFANNSKSLPVSFGDGSTLDPLPLFSPRQTESGVLFSVGAPVTSCRWLNSVGPVRYLVLTTASDFNFIPDESADAVLQIYLVSLQDKTVNASLHFCLKLPNFGTVWDMSCWPSQLAEFGSAECSFVTVTSHTGCVSILRIPLNVESSPDFINVYEAKSSLQLIGGAENVPCYSVQWNPYGCMSTIVASYANGSICVWDLSNLNESSDACGIISASNTFPISGLPVTQVHWVSEHVVMAACHGILYFDVVQGLSIREVCMRNPKPRYSALLSIPFEPDVLMFASGFRECKPCQLNVFLKASRCDVPVSLSKSDDDIVWALGLSPLGHVLAGDNAGNLNMYLFDWEPNYPQMYVKKRIASFGTKHSRNCIDTDIVQCANAGCSVDCSFAQRCLRAKKPVSNNSQKVSENEFRNPLSAVLCLDILSNNKNSSCSDSDAFYYCCGSQAGLLHIGKVPFSPS